MMEMALRQHLPRSPIWNYLAKRQNLHQESVSQLGEVKRRVEITTRSKKMLGPLISAGLSGVVSGIIDALTSQAVQWSHDHPELKIESDLVATPAGGDLIEIHYGDFRMCIVDSQDAEGYLKTIGQVIKGLESSIVEWKIYDDLKKTNTEIDRLDRKLHEELAVIRLRRIVPGRCRFCPI